MASKRLILLVLIFSITVETEARVRFNNGHGVVLAQTAAPIDHVHPATQMDARPDSSSPDEMKNEGFATAPPPSSSTKQQNILKAVIVVVILVVTSGGVIVVIRIACSCPENLTRDENESKSFGIRTLDPERPTYEPKPGGGATLNYELTICKCNNTFALCGLSA